jgi:hypothetical protein
VSICENDHIKQEESGLFRKFIRELGFALISYGTMFSPLIAFADDGDTTLGVIVGFPVGAVITGTVLVSMSRTKAKATKADKYIESKLDLHDSKDVYIRTETSKVKVGK